MKNNCFLKNTARNFQLFKIVELEIIYLTLHFSTVLCHQVASTQEKFVSKKKKKITSKCTSNDHKTNLPNWSNIWIRINWFTTSLFPWIKHWKLLMLYHTAADIQCSLFKTCFSMSDVRCKQVELWIFHFLCASLHYKYSPRFAATWNRMLNSIHQHFPIQWLKIIHKAMKCCLLVSYC